MVNRTGVHRTDRHCITVSEYIGVFNALFFHFDRIEQNRDMLGLRLPAPFPDQLHYLELGRRLGGTRNLVRGTRLGARAAIGQFRPGEFFLIDVAALHALVELQDHAVAVAPFATQPIEQYQYKQYRHDNDQQIRH